MDKDSTVIVEEGAGNPEAISNRVESHQSQIETTTSQFDRENLGQERLAKLSGGVAVIKGWSSN